MAKKRRVLDGDRVRDTREARSRSGTPWRPKKRHRPHRVRRPGLRDLPKEILRKLGTMPDKRLAALAGVHPHTIFRERHHRGIAAYQAISPAIVWTEEMIGKLGTATDREVAAELGIKPSSVASKRRNLGIPPFTPPRAVQPGRHWEPENLARLGQVSDRSLAKELRLSPSTVAHKRQSLGIAPWRPRPPRVEWTEEMNDLLGKLSDLEIARRFSISPSSVKLAREMRGIPARARPASAQAPPALP